MLIPQPAINLELSMLTCNAQKQEYSQTHQIRHPLSTIRPTTLKQKKMKSRRLSKQRKQHHPRGESVAKGRRYNRYMANATALRTHRDRLAQVTQDTFHTVLTVQGYHEDIFTDDDADLITTGIYHDLSGQIMRTRQETAFYPHHCSLLAEWANGPTLSDRGQSGQINTIPNDITSPHTSSSPSTKVEFVSSSTLSATRKAMSSNLQVSNLRIGVLNCSSPKKPGGASLSGGDTQEECLVRQTTLLDSLQNSKAGMQFYSEHRSESDGSGLHDHSLLYSPEVIVFKDDRGRRVAPSVIDVVSAVPVNANTVLAKFNVDRDELRSGIRSVMHERMARILRLFEERGDRTLVLSAFGVGQFCNSPDMIGEIWADLIGTRAARFRGVFDRIIFVVSPKHLSTFENSFNSRVLESELLHE